MWRPARALFLARALSDGIYGVVMPPKARKAANPPTRTKGARPTRNSRPYSPPPVRRTAPPSAFLGAVLGLLLTAGLVVTILINVLPSHTSHDKTAPPGKRTSTSAPVVQEKGMRPCQLSTSEQNSACAQAKAYAKQLLKQMGKEEQFGCLDTLWDHESNWNAWSVNTKYADPDLQAYGIPQNIPKYHGRPYKVGEWKKQVDWGMSYIEGRYETPCAAWAWWQHPGAPPYDQNWY